MYLIDAIKSVLLIMVNISQIDIALWGVIVSETKEESNQAIRAAFSGKNENSGKKLLLEERLQGPEVSVFALCDGKNLILLPPAQDHKRLNEGDTGPNTGGMGAYAPATLLNEEQLNEIKILMDQNKIGQVLCRRCRNGCSCTVATENCGDADASGDKQSSVVYQVFLV